MENFFYSVPTKAYFGKGVISKVGELAKEFGQKAMILKYDDGVMEKIGLLDAVIESLNASGVEYVILNGIMPNPLISKVDEGIELCHKEGVDVLIPLGGGSCIDSAKCVAAAYYYDGPAWDVVLNSSLVTDCLPIIAIPTLAATGSDMDSGAMICDDASGVKKALGTPGEFPKYSLLDPEYTYSVPRKQTAFGVADIMSHIFEVYFSKSDGAFFADRIMEAMLKTCVKYGTIACDDPTNYEARANLLWTASWGCNGFFYAGKTLRRWSVHPMEHVLSGHFGDPHGQGIAILTPIWMRYILNNDTVEMFAAYGENVLNIAHSSDPFVTANAAIDATEALFHSWGIPKNLHEAGIVVDESQLEEMALEAMGPAGSINAFVPLYKDDIVKIYRSAL